MNVSNLGSSSLFNFQDNNQVIYLNGRLIQPQHIECHKKSFVTALTVHHYPSFSDKGDMTCFIERLNNVELIKDFKNIINEIQCEAKKLYDDLYKMRSDYFSVVNEGKTDVYGILTEGASESDRDNYIKSLMAFQMMKETLIQLAHKPDFDVLKVPLLSELTPHHSEGIYGDLFSLKQLREGQKAELPDLTYNRGEYQFG